MDRPRCIVCDSLDCCFYKEEYSYKVFLCRDCDVLFVFPHPDPRQIEEVYMRSEYSPENVAYWEKRGRRTFIRLLQKLELLRHSGTLLDVGCGYGLFLKYARERGWKVYGVDICKEECRYAVDKLGLDVFNGTLFDASYPDKYFDVITLWNVLEHVPDPVSLLKECCRIMKEGGLLLLRVPNMALHWRIRFIWERMGKTLLNPPQHLYGFGPKNLDLLLQRVGFSSREITNADISGDSEFVQKMVGKVLGKMIRFFAANLPKVLSSVSLGRILLSPSLLVIAVKKTPSIPATDSNVQSSHPIMETSSKRGFHVTVDSKELPLVSIVIPMYNEEGFIEECLNTVIEQDYPKNKMELLVIDGMSTDKSAEIVKKWIPKYPFIRLLKNPKRIIPAAMNMGITNAQGEIIIRLDAHSYFAKDYVSKCVEYLLKTRVGVVGGPKRTVGKDYVGRVISAAVTSLFGIGPATAQIKKERFVDSVPFGGAAYKSTIIKAGGYDEALVTNEDYDLQQRIRKQGGKVLVTPEIKLYYRARGSFAGLWNQYFKYGFYKLVLLKKAPDTTLIIHLIPGIFVFSLIITGVLGLIFQGLLYLFLYILGLYAVINLASSILVARRQGWTVVLLLPLAYATIHFAYGLGFMVSVIKHGVPRLNLINAIRKMRPD